MTAADASETQAGHGTPPPRSPIAQTTQTMTFESAML
jgi:hypothetical protein